MPRPGITKKAIATSLKELMADYPLAKINVGDIVEQCGLNRNSFYYHFKDKFDLVNWIFYTEIAAEFKRDEIESISSWDLINRFCHYFYRNKEFYINALSVSGQNSFEEYYILFMKSLVLIRASDLFSDDESRDFYLDFFLDPLSSAILRWLRKGATIPPDEFTSLVKKAATGMAMHILEEN